MFKNTTIPALGALLALYWLPVQSRALETHDRIRQIAPASLGTPGHRKYAPDRRIDILHLALHITPDFQRRTIQGEEHLRFQPIAEPLSELRLNAVELDISHVTANRLLQSWHTSDNYLIIDFARPVPAGANVQVTIRYHAQPSKGLYFRTAEMGYPKSDTHLFTQGEAIESRHWFPCFDAPNEKFTSEVSCTVPPGMTVLSNGRLVGSTRDSSTGLKTVRWSQDKPHSTYLISLVAGYFKGLHDQYRDVPLSFYTPASEFAQAANSFADTKDIMGFYEREIGVPYPWAKYGQVCVEDFVAGGMENTSLTTLTDRTLHTRATGNLQTSQNLVAHEMAHQWFGDLVTCKDWSQIWLNEGFATYYAHLYDGHKNGRDAMLYGFYRDARGILNHAGDTLPIVYREYGKPMDQFGYRAYPKGSWVLRMLRARLGDALYRRCIETYLHRHEFGNVTTDDLREVIEELSGRNFDRFFDQWVYHGLEPELRISYHWDGRTKLAQLHVEQTQKVSEQVMLFQFPLAVRFRVGGRPVDRSVRVTQKSEDFYFPLKAEPKAVRVDPGYTVLAKITFDKPAALWTAQLTPPTDVVGRLLAMAHFSNQKNHAAVQGLQKVLTHDPFYGVRLEAAKALRSIHTDEALEALLASREQADARVRRQVVQAIGGFYQAKALKAALALVRREKNPLIVRSALETLGAYPAAKIKPILLRYLDTPSYREELAVGAIAAIRAQDDPAYAEPLRRVLKRREGSFDSHDFGRALDTLAYISRHEANKSPTRQFLLGYVNTHKMPVRLAAIRALGRLKAPKAVAVLEKFAGSSKESPEHDPAEKAIEAIRAEEKPAEEIAQLRQELLDLKKDNQNLRREFENLKQQWEKLPVADRARK